MANGMNKVYLLGNVGRSPELKHTKDGTALLKVRLATTERYKDRHGDLQERTEWHNVSVWGKRAEGLHGLLDTGDCIMVEGRLRHSSYDKDGVTRYTTDVNASQVHFTGSRDRSRRDDRGADHRPAAQPSSSYGSGARRAGGAEQASLNV